MDFTKVLEAKKKIVWQEIEKYLQKPLHLTGPLKISKNIKKKLIFIGKLLAIILKEKESI